MLDRFLDRIASGVTRRRRLVIVTVLGIAIVCASQLPRLGTDASPEELMVSNVGYAEAAREFRAHFGDTDSVVLLLVGADDVTALAPLRYVHVLSRHFEGANHPRRRGAGRQRSRNSRAY